MFRSAFCKRALLWSGLSVHFLLFAAHARAAQEAASESERVRQLEARVAQLEQTVAELKVLLGTPRASPATTAQSAASKAVEQISPESPQLQPAQQPLPEHAKKGFEMPPELIPEIGKIGAEVGLFLSASSSPLKLGTGNFTGGYIDLPLFDRPRWLHGKVSYEILVGLTQSSTTFNTTSNVAQVANLAVLDTLNPTGGASNLTQAVQGTGAAPFPVTVSSQTKLRLLQVIPFALKYTPTAFERWRLRPYAVAGFGAYVTIHVQNPGKGVPSSNGVRQNAALPADVLTAVNALFGGKAPFGGPLVAGQISQSPELEARGLPGGHGNLDIGYQAGGGLTVRLTRTLSLGFDARYNRIAGTYGSFVTYGSRIGIHF